MVHGWLWRVYIWQFLLLTAQISALGLTLSSYHLYNFSKGAVSLGEILFKLFSLNSKMREIQHEFVLPLLFCTTVWTQQTMQQ